VKEMIKTTLKEIKRKEIKMKDLTKEQLEQITKEHKQQTQLILVNDLLDKMQHLANKTMRVDYEPSFEETQKILQIKRLADTILKNIS
jgi:hypothetical protein